MHPVGLCRELRPGRADLVVGSDVVFAMRFVEPLLQTVEALLEA